MTHPVQLDFDTVSLTVGKSIQQLYCSLKRFKVERQQLY